jgi:hypothetical protein
MKNSTGRIKWEFTRDSKLFVKMELGVYREYKKEIPE